MSTSLTTGIGSLPHHNVDTAIDFSFRFGIPFLPQIPIRNPHEFMIAQALEGLPGLQVEKDGSVFLDAPLWIARAAEFSARLERALQDDTLLVEFEPSALGSSCWQPFVWELGEKSSALAKIQIAGPMTTQWALSAAAFHEKHPELSSQIFQLVLVRALAMSRRLQSLGVQPLIYLDEPGLCGFSPDQPRHWMAFQELKLLVQALRKKGVWVGLHCCGDTHWPSILSLPLNYLSLDTEVSLSQLLAHPTELGAFIKSGGKLSLGVVPTANSSTDAADLVRALLEKFATALEAEPELVHQILREAIFTPACGLALQTGARAEWIMTTLLEVENQVEGFLAQY